MNVADVHGKIVADYENYIRSFIDIADPFIAKRVQEDLKDGKLWPEPLLQFNPSFKLEGKVEDLARNGTVHRDVADIFKGYSLYRHQIEAIRLGTSGKDFVVTSGTGSGKSLTYIGTIFSHLLNQPASKGVTAVVVYPMNALINSQKEEFDKYRKGFEAATGRPFPISFGQYTGQEDQKKRQGMRENPPQILLTNYMMLELLLTREQERSIRDAIYANLRFLVFDELHTYRGRQGADVAMLIRRIRAKSANPVACIGTSATMVSGGTLEDQRAQVARVATTLFGKQFEPGQIVNETLDRSLDGPGAGITQESLAKALQDGFPAEGIPDDLRSNPVAIWLENFVALEEKEGGILTRRKPMKISQVQKSLADHSGLPTNICCQRLNELLLWISKTNESLGKQGKRYTFLPFRLHQFIAQTGSVYATLDREDDHRFVTLEPGVFKTDENSKPIYPHVFSRDSGRPFICVRLTGNKMLPREFNDNSEEENQREDGYLIVGDDVWNPDEDMDALPDTWFRLTKTGRTPLSDKETQFPQQIWYDTQGNYSREEGEYPLTAWFMTAPLLFDPTSGTFFDGKTREGTKLAKLGSEGRSTSTTITAFSTLNRLREAGYSMANQKLISFTDSRQDAALQAGHFNDFVQVIHLRAGIYKALQQAEGHKLDYTKLGKAVFQALNLPFTDFSVKETKPSLDHVVQEYERYFQDFLVYRALADLERSWKIILPNLEQCGLLRIEYRNLEITAKDSVFWGGVPLVGDLRPEARQEFLATVLDFLRMSFALEEKNYLPEDKRKENEKQFRNNLRAPWTLEDKETLRPPRHARVDTLANNAKLVTQSLGVSSGLGKYIKHFFKNHLAFHDRSKELKGEPYREFIGILMGKLAEADYISIGTVKSRDGQEAEIYRLRVDKIEWHLGDGETVKADVIKRRSYKGLEPKPNRFFQNLYQQDFSQGKRLRAEDHTGQLNYEDRQKREDGFRCDWWLDEDKKTIPDNDKIRSRSISALFCSPTMELGIDIGGLSVVHMRNAPPNPANYAQRSGRAGRSGQGALVFTYCSGFSAHDRHFFQHQEDMVAGTVQAPRLDLLNKELLLSHLTALAVSEVGLPGLDSGGGGSPSLTLLLDKDAKGQPMLPSVIDGLKLPDRTRQSIKATFTRVIHDFQGDLEAKASGWFSGTWIETSLNNLAGMLDKSLNRWRKLHLAAKATLIKATQRIESGTLTTGSEEYKAAARTQSQSTRQLNLLENKGGGFSHELSEFYPFRYLASEGFLPGYNFTRLPLRIFIPTTDSSGEYISRPRAIALKEFGPLNIIYHNGRKYRVDQLVAQNPGENRKKAKISKKVGYFLEDDDNSLNVCPFSKLDLSDNANVLRISDLLEMAESRATEVERISCEEEERALRGFEIDTYFTLDNDLDRVRKATALVDGTPMLNLRFMPAARLVYVNRRWRTSSTDGFPMGMTTGYWTARMPEKEKSEKDKGPQPEQEEVRYVQFYTSNLADSLYIEPVQSLGLDRNGVITLQYALKRAIEMEFQAEPNELGVVSMGDQEPPNILLYEAAEGSLGILSRFTEDPGTLGRIAQRALEICRYDDPEYKAPASYDDLLSYFNQRDHLILNRFLIQGALEKLKTCTIEIQSNSGYESYEAHYLAMCQQLDPNSSTERKFLDHLYQNGLRLPDKAQPQVPGMYCQPDFYYESRIWIFCDGTPHDDPQVMADDKVKRSELINRGDEVWVYYYKDDLASKVADRPDIFKKVR